MIDERLDNPTLLRLALEAIQDARDVEAVGLLKRVLEREPDNLHAQYLLAIQHAQLGLYERAEQRLREVLTAAPQFVVARFQLAQLLVMRGTVKDAREWLQPVLTQADPLGTYARGLLAAAQGDRNAFDYRTRLEGRMTEGEIAEEKRLVREFLAVEREL